MLFPGVLQPLHIFEPRYRQLLEDCLAGDRRFGLSLVNPERKGNGVPQPGDVGCTTVIRSHSTLPDGRSNVLTAGEDRYVFKQMLDRDRLYHVGLVEPFYDSPGDDPGMPDLTAKVRRFFREFVRTVQDLPDEGSDAIDLPDDPEQLSYHIAASLDVDLATKEALVRLTSTRVRLERLAAILKPLIVEAARRASMQRLAKRNAKGTRAPPVTAE